MVFAGSLSNPKFPVRGTKLTGAPRPSPVSSKRESLCRKRQAGRKVGTDQSVESTCSELVVLALGKESANHQLMSSRGPGQ
ncbi:hypothetical protein DPEC_G00370000 [Dallia pectoralis]|nr:hypothetical protein DPEC_G00370000 [Dallia pectoralis]